MILHANAALSRRQRERLVSLVVAGATITAAAELTAGFPQRPYEDLRTRRTEAPALDPR